MTTIAATEAKNRFGELLEVIHKEPVEISKKGRAVAVVLSIKDYEEMLEKLGRETKKTDFSGIQSWIKKHRKIRTGEPLDKADYYKHLDGKYGS